MPSGMSQMSATAQDLYRSGTLIVQDAISSLGLPSFSEYWSCCQVAARDIISVSRSLSRVGYLTFRPVVLLLVLLSRGLWIVLRFFAIHLFGQLYVSLKHSYRQLRVGTRMFVSWQRSLSRGAVGIELCVLGVVTLCFLLRRHIKKKKYVQRTAQWYKGKKRKIERQYNRLVRRISQTSLFLAMLLPHAVFLGVGTCIKLLLPRVVIWAVRDTAATSALSLWYPFVATSSLLCKYRARQHYRANNRTDSTPHHGKKANTKGTKTGIYPRTAPVDHNSASSPEGSRHSAVKQRWFRAGGAAQSASDIDLVESAEYWLQYWVVFSLVSATSRILAMIPIVGRILSHLSSLAGFFPQVELLFYLWINMVPVLLSGDNAANALERENRPLQLVYRRIAPVAAALVNYTSHAIPSSVWDKVVSTTGSVLDVCVMIKIFSSGTRDRVLHIVQESAPFLPPAVTLFMPSFITSFGVVYCKSVVPSAMSKQALDPVSYDSTHKDDSVILMLEYWVLHCLLDWFLGWWAPILWWIPFSTHVTFCLWCLLQMPKTTASWYNTWEEELMSFGLMSRHDGRGDVQVEKTITASVVRYLYSKLPSASDGGENSGSKKREKAGGHEEEQVNGEETKYAEVY